MEWRWAETKGGRLQMGMAVRVGGLLVDPQKQDMPSCFVFALAISHPRYIQAGTHTNTHVKKAHQQFLKYKNYIME